MAKIGKSIRVSQKVFDYIEAYNGEGFNEKFENIILDAMESEKKRKDKIKALDKSITEKQDIYNSLLKDVSDKRVIVFKLEEIFRICDQIPGK